MTIINAKNLTERFTIISKDITENKALTWECRGLLIFLLGKPSNWNISVSHLQKQGNSGRDKIYKMLKQLMEAGHVVRKQSRSEGKADGWDYIVHADAQHTAFQDAEKSDQHTAFQEAEIQEAETRALISTDKKQVKKKINNKPLCSNSSNAPKADDEKIDWVDMEKRVSESIIEDFWQNYPKKVDKKKSIELLRKMIKKNDSQAFWQPILAHLREKAAVTLRTFWPSPYRFLHDELWNDEIIHYDYSKPSFNTDTNSYTFPVKSYPANSTRNTSVTQNLTDTSWNTRPNRAHDCGNGITVEFEND